jgi:uncharacterized protein YbjT (DUF2867 family)
MDNTNKIVLVTGATGRQGGATAHQLLAKGWRVRAIVRDPNKPAAQGLRQTGVEVVQGDYENRASLDAAMQGVYGVFSVQAAFGETEAQQAQQIADAAKSAGVEHFIYTSVQSAEDLARVGGDATKWDIEQYIHTLNLPSTILRPSFFMETLIAPRTDVPDGAASDTFTIAVKPDATMGLIAVDDIGAFAVLAFENPTAYIGKTIELAGDILTPPQIADAISRVTGHLVRYVQLPIETLRKQSIIISNAVDYLNKVGYTTDVSALRQQHPDLMDFEAWLNKVGKSIFTSTTETA